MKLTFKERLQAEEFAKKLYCYYFNKLLYDKNIEENNLPIFVDENIKPSIIDIISVHDTYYDIKEHVDVINENKKFTVIPNSNLKIKWRIGKKRECEKLIDNYIDNKNFFDRYVLGRGFWVYGEDKTKEKEIIWYADSDLSYKQQYGKRNCDYSYYSTILIGELERVDEK